MKKPIALLLIFTIFVIWLVSCSEGMKQPNMTQGDSSSDTVPAGKEELDEFGRPVVPDHVPKNLDYDGAAVRILYDNHIDYDCFPEENGEDHLSVALYERTTTVSDRLDITYEYSVFSHPEVRSRVEEAYRTQDDLWDIVQYYPYNGLSMVENGYFIDLSNMPYIDTEKTWWDSNYIDELTYNDKYYSLMGDIMLSNLAYKGCIFFNEELLETMRSDVDIYQYVYDGVWTIDTFTSLIKDSYVDLNFDQRANLGDFYGYAVAGPDREIEAMNITVTERDGDGFSIALNSPEIVNSFEKLLKLVYNNNSTLKLPQITGSFEQILSEFTVGNLMFMSGVMSHAAEFTDDEFEFGILPMYKYSEEQPEYYHTDYGTSNVMSIPAVCDTSRHEMIGAVLELLAAESYRQLTPAYFEIVFKYRYLRTEDGDTRDFDMYDIIRETGNYNFGFSYSDSWAVQPLTILRDIVNENPSGFASYFGQIQGVLEQSLANTLEKLDNIPY